MPSQDHDPRVSQASGMIRLANDMTGLFDLPSLRSTLTERLDLVERARMDCRRALWRLQVAEGATIAEVAREWGLSRQLVSRALANDDTKVSS